MSSAKDKVSPDDLDHRLLALLRKDARTPIARLSRTLKISRASTYARLQKLQKAGVIEGFTVRVNEKFHSRLIRAHVLIKVAGKLARAAQRQLRAIPEIVALHAISGVYDLIAELEAPGVTDLNEIIDRMGELDGVEKTNSSILLATMWSLRD